MDRPLLRPPGLFFRNPYVGVAVNRMGPAHDTLTNAHGADFLPSDSAVAMLIRAFDWSETSLGPMARWPQSLKTAVSILLHSPAPMVLLWGLDGIMIYNDAYSVFAGHRHPKLLGSPVLQGWPEVADFNREIMKVGLSGGTLSFQGQHLVLYRHGVPEDVWMDLNYSPVLDERGRPAGVLAIVVETTERVLAEGALAKSRERLSHALEAAGMVGTFDWHIQPDIFYSDARFAAMFSVDPEKGEQGTSLSEYLAGLHPDDVAGAREAVNRAIETGEKFVHEYRVVHRDGTVRWIEARGGCLYDADGRPWRFPGVVVDITERKEAERALRHSEAFLRLMLDAAADGFYCIDRDGRTTLCNAAFLRMLGFAREEDVIGRSLHDVIHHSHPDGSPYPEPECPLHRTARTGEPAHVEGELFFHQDGTSFPVEYWVHPIRSNGILRGAVCTFLDITERQRAREQQTLLLRELNHRVKNLFAVMGGMLTLSARYSDTPQEMAKTLRGRLDALSRAHALIRPGLTGEVDREGQRTTLEALIREVLSPYVEEPDGSERERLVASGPSVAVGGNAATSLALVLHELTTNAAKYGALSVPDGIVSIEWEDQESRLALTWRERGGPAVNGAPERKGFGHLLAERSISGQLDGQISYDWRPEGLAVLISIPTQDVNK